MNRPRCSADHCGRFAAADSQFCSVHVRAQISTPAPQPSGWLAPGFAGEVAAAGANASLDNELGALRYALARAMQEIEDPVKLARAIAQLAGATATVARTRRVLDGAQADAVTDAIESILLELSEASR